jgi:2-phospho-L-lactate guanylyltransferase
MTTAGIFAVVPAKDFDKAKSRLSAALDQQGRAELARRLFLHVLQVLGSCSELAGVLVLTDSDEVEALSRAAGARVVRDAGVFELGEIVDGALATLADANAALIVMADLPELSARDVRELVELAPRFDVVVAPDRHELRTNALYLAAPFTPTRFGQDGSFARHVADAQARGARSVVHRSPGLGLDLDEPADLLFWQTAKEPAGVPGAAE